MLLKDNGDIDSASDSDNNDSMPSLEDVEEDVEYPTKEEALVIRRVLNVQLKPEEHN